MQSCPWTPISFLKSTKRPSRAASATIVKRQLVIAEFSRLGVVAARTFRCLIGSLKEFFPKFLGANPELATKAYVRAVHGYVLRDHPPRDTQVKQVIHAVGRTCSLHEDRSYIWASKPDDRHGDNAIEIAQHFSKWLRSATPDEAMASAQTIISENEMALVWARLFMVAAERSDILGPLLWPIATSYPFLWASDTRKDGIDFIAATYPNLTVAVRIDFEERVLAYQFADATDPAKARGYVLKRLFATIGSDRLLKEEARAFATITDQARSHDYQNDRPVSFEITSHAADEYWWLRDEKVDTDAPENADLLARAKSFKDDLQERNRTRAFPGVDDAVAKLAGFLSAVDTRSGTHALVKSYATGVAAEGLEALVSMFERELATHAESADILISMAVRFASHPLPEVGPDTEEQFEKFASWGSPAPRVATAHAAMSLARLNEPSAHRLRRTIEQLLVDQHPAVRMGVASRINALWLSERPLMWRLCDRVVSEERNGNVLSFFANEVLGRLVHSDPERVEALTMKLSEGSRNEDARKNLREQIGTLISILWVSHQRPRAKAVMENWLSYIVENDEELNHAISTLRGAVVLGFGSKKDADVQIRRRSIEFANWVSEVTCANLAAFFANPSNGTPEQKLATASAKILHHLLNQLYFSSGAFRHGGSNDQEDKVLASLESKREFLFEITPILQRMTDVGTPETIHHLIDLLEFLMDADPEAVFGLVARALLGAGQKQGYEFESLGADQVVKLIGRFLADHRGLFDKQEHRQTLVNCLDAFIEAGWPSARRLLYRLPELLQ